LRPSALLNIIQIKSSRFNVKDLPFSELLLARKYEDKFPAIDVFDQLLPKKSNKLTVGERNSKGLNRIAKFY
jgi:hypothetical protein